MNKPATIKDIARLTGFSASTVSRALKGHPDISPATASKVRDVADALGYVPHSSAQALRTQSSRLIAMVLPRMDNFFFPELLAGVGEAVEARGYSLLFLQSNNRLEREKELLAYCARMRVEGLLFSVSRETRETDHLEALRQTGVPIVLIDHILDETPFPTLTIDDEGVAYTAVRYLVEHGHRAILGLFDQKGLRMSRLRKAGYQRALLEHGLTPKADWMLDIGFDDDVMQDQISAFLSRHPEASAVFTMSDKLMVRAYHAINQLGYHIPEDIALIAISDGKAPHYLFPKITHMRHSGRETGELATRFLFEYLANQQLPPRFEPVPAQLVEGGSV